MNDHVVIVAGLLVFCAFAAAIVALFLGRGIKARGVARFGAQREVSLQVEVPESKRSNRGP